MALDGVLDDLSEVVLAISWWCSGVLGSWQNSDDHQGYATGSTNKAGRL